MATAEHNRILRVAPPVPSLYGGEDLPRVRFVAEVAARGYVHLAHDEFPGAVDAGGAAALGRAELVRVNAAGSQLEAFVWLPDELACLIDLCHGRVDVEVAGPDPAAVRAALGGVRERLRRVEDSPATVPLVFWLRGPQGGLVRHREIEATAWEPARANYPAAVGRALDGLMALREPARGRLIVWRGPPGTGKTWALRALATAWRGWCSVHYILDPLALMSGDPRYLLDVLAWQDENAGVAWRLLVLEDAGELIVHDAGRTGALAALLNITDGILGQGSGTLVLVTTNEPVAHLHPAVRRRGRCLADVEFGPLSRDESREWLARAGSEHEPDGPLTLAELYALVDGGASGDDEVVPAPGTFGFGRVLAGS
jgi:Domain of unknown function (DUF5925)/ATPase family associated with various cellular activities (AAA)